MKISKDYPPNFDEIKKHFDVTNGVLFCYGDTIYNPYNEIVRPDLDHHESIHMVQQGDDPAGWWKRYVEDVNFRISQEVEAYAAQAEYIRKHIGKREYEQSINAFARFISGPVYGYAIGRGKALKLLTELVDKKHGKNRWFNGLWPWGSR